MNNKQIFDSLALNAFDFLTRAVAEFEASPKYSVIHFCAAVEMLLKAKLLREHWSLVVAKPQEASRMKFEAGDFISVSLSETRTRLKEIVRVEISDLAFRSFEALSKHRNKMIHFYHAGVTGDAKERERIASEQCLAWFYLHGLLQQWKADFKEHKDAIESADKVMRGHRKYLEQKFLALREELKKRTAAGEQVCTCQSCGFESAILATNRSCIYDGECLVCERSGTYVGIDCPHCSSLILLAEAYCACPHCDKEIDPDKIKGALIDPAEACCAIEDGDDDYWNVNCDHCGGYHSAIRVEGNYLCTNCFGVFDQVQACDWCNELNTGDMTDSYASGCNHCVGWIGHQRDD